jgi:hypothetical protein
MVKGRRNRRIGSKNMRGTASEIHAVHLQRSTTISVVRYCSDGQYTSMRQIVQCACRIVF